jgi:hypothetical protein
MYARDRPRVAAPAGDRVSSSSAGVAPKESHIDPSIAWTPVGVLALQRTVGNAAAVRVLARDLKAGRRKKLDDAYQAAVAKGDWKAAAEHLNGFNREDIVSRLAKRSVEEIAKLHQGALDNAAVGPDAQVALLTPELLTSYAGKFRASADLILSSPEAMKLVQEADAATVKFGGFAEDGPSATPVAYTMANTVYTPRAHTDKVVAMSDFLFELNNAIRLPQFQLVHKAGREGKIDAREYARRTVELEVEGMLRLGKIWSETKRIMGGGKALDKYDAPYYLAEFTAVRKGKKTQAQIVADVSARKYSEGTNKGKTAEQVYMEQFEELFGKK